MSQLIKFEDYKDKILEALRVKRPLCQVCHKGPSVLIDSFINQPLQKELTGSLVVGGPSLPMVAVVCQVCGRIDFFALKALLPDLEL